MIILAAHLSAKERISSDEERIILSKETNREKAVALLMCVQRKGWECLQELSNGLKLPDFHPLHELSGALDTEMEQCGEFTHFLSHITIKLRLKEMRLLAHYANIYKYVCTCQRDPHIFSVQSLGI